MSMKNPELAECEFLECGDTLATPKCNGGGSPLSNWQTCLPVPKRRRAGALQVSAMITI
jgi:hypothetical protein